MQPGTPGDRDLSDGEFVTVLLQGAQPVQTLAIPQAAVLSDQQGNYVYVVGADNKAVPRRITLGQAAGALATVTTGLKQGEVIISDGVQRVRPEPAGQPGALRTRAPAALAGRPAAPTPARRGSSPMISGVFVDRPRLAIVIAIVITIAGALALTRIPVAQFPDIVPPQVQVTANYPGASAAVVEASVAQPIEAQVIGVDKMLYMKSTNGNDGSYNLTVSFELGTNPDINTVNVNNRVQTAMAELPPSVTQQGLTIQKRSSAILEFVNLYSDEGKQDPLFITNYATINVLDEISRTPGVGQANLFSRLKYSMRIWFDTNRLTSLNLAPQDIITAIQAQNVVAPIGRIGARPVSSDVSFQFNLQTQGRLTTPEQFGNIVIRANPDGSVLRVKDVARLELGAQNEDSESRLNGQPSVAMAIYLAPGANAVNTAAAVNSKLQQLSTRFPDGLHFQVTYDSTTFVTDTIHEVLKTLGEAFVLVIIVVFLFLGNLRATLIPTIAVPVSLIGAFAGLLALGYSANTVSLLALVLAIGIVVDDAIVVVENVERVMEENPDSGRRRRRPRRRCSRSPRRSSPSRWCCCRCSCRSPSSPASPGSCSGSSLSPSACRC